MNDFYFAITMFIKIYTYNRKKIKKNTEKKLF